jgi:hypothetical protein
MNEIEMKDRLYTKVRTLFQLMDDELDHKVDHLIRSGCGVLDDEARQYPDAYIVAKAVLCAFLDDQVYRMEQAMNGKPEFHELFENYSKFL